MYRIYVYVYIIWESGECVCWLFFSFCFFGWHRFRFFFSFFFCCTQFFRNIKASSNSKGMVPFYLMNSIRAYLLCAAVRDDQKGIQKKNEVFWKEPNTFCENFQSNASGREWWSGFNSQRNFQFGKQFQCKSYVSKLYLRVWRCSRSEYTIDDVRIYIYI